MAKSSIGKSPKGVQPGIALRQPWLLYSGLLFGMFFFTAGINQVMVMIAVISGNESLSPGRSGGTIAGLFFLGGLVLAFVIYPIDTYIIHAGQAVVSRPQLKKFAQRLCITGLLGMLLTLLMPAIYSARRAGQNTAITHAMDQGQASMDKRDYDTAIADFDEAIRLDPKFAPAYVNRGLAYAAKGDLDKAFADCTKAIELKPDYADAYYGRGDAFLRKCDWDSRLPPTPKLSA